MLIYLKKENYRSIYTHFQIQEEISIMQALRHPKILQLAAAFETAREMIMVVE